MGPWREKRKRAFLQKGRCPLREGGGKKGQNIPAGLNLEIADEKSGE